MCFKILTSLKEHVQNLKYITAVNVNFEIWANILFFNIYIDQDKKIV